MVTVAQRDRAPHCGCGSCWFESNQSHVLHGEIKVNYDVIGFYYIRRTHKLRSDEPSLYEFEVEYPLGTFHKGHVHHLYDDGALVLIKKVLELCVG